MDDATLSRLIDVGRSLLSELDLDVVLGRVLEVARDVTGARFAAVGIMDRERSGLERFVTSGIDADQRATIGELPRGHGVLGLLIDEPHPLRLDDVGAHPRSYGFPLNHPPMRRFLGVPILIRGEAWGNLYLTEKTGGDPFSDGDEEAMVVLADWAAIAVANARLYQAATSRRDELERTVRALETTTEISSAIGGEIELDRILELLVKRGRALVSARTLVVALVEGDELCVSAAAGDVPDDLLGGRAPLEDSVMGAVLRSRRPERLTDLSRRAEQPLTGNVRAEAGLMVPLLHRGQAIGVLGAFDRLEHGPEFTADDERLVLAFAATAATAVATAQSARSQSLERSLRASEAERTRWARELHDETLQELGGLRVLLSAARRSEERRRVDLALDQALDLVTQGIANLRALITDLRPAALDEIGTQAALMALADRVRATSGVVVELAFEVDGAEARYAPEVEETVYRVVQEALTNAVKHADAEQVDVSVREQDDRIRVVVRDDGRGFDPERRSAGFGLVGMRERIVLLDGALRVRSAAGEGTTVEVELPVSRRPARDDAAPRQSSSNP